jgi:hypothetical protein
MIKRMLLFPFLLFILWSCNGTDKTTDRSAEDDLDVARNFIHSALIGDFRTASSYMLSDSTNEQYLDATERNYQKLSPEEKKNLREASLRIYNTDKLNDSTTVVIYANSFKNKKDTLKLIRKDAKWQADLKYIFEHNADSASQRSAKDSIAK